MSGSRSLKLRFLALGFGLLVAALVVTGLSLTALFSRYFDQRVSQELDTHVEALAGTLRIDPQGVLSLTREPADPRFTRPFGGLYWQVLDETSGTRLTSRSLWDAQLASDGELAPGARRTHDADGPQGSTLLLLERALVIRAGTSDHLVRIAAAIDRSQFGGLRSGFVRDAVLVLAAVGLVLAIGIWVQVASGLRPLASLAQAVGNVRSGRQRRLDTAVPREVEPLVAEVNSLLDAQERDLTRARDRAADLAHGLKTPLTALASDIRRLRDSGQADVADNLEALSDSMRRHVERELVRTRIRHGAARPSAGVADAVSRVVGVVKRTPHADGKAFEMDIASGLTALIDRDDVNELLGNLIDNATRHARALVRISSEASVSRTLIRVEDDGPGLSDSQRETALARGVRLDSGGGAGLGLAIVRDIADAYGGEVTLGRSGLGGLRVEISLPTAT